MKLFHLYRVEDQSGVSGTGPVVEGVEFTNGWCALRWVTQMSTLCFYPSLETVRAVHGHGGKTELIVHDFEPLSKKPSERSSSRFELLLEIIEEASRVTTLAEDPEGAVEAARALDRLRDLLDELEADLGSPRVA
jgi:hypothetical protein